MKEEIEVLNEDFIMDTDAKKDDHIIPLDKLFENNSQQEIDVYEEEKQKEKIMQKRITKIQIGLIIFLALFASLVYFFGYNFFEPFIKID